MNGCGIFHFWHVQDKNTLATLRFVQWTNRLYVQSNVSLEFRLYLANCAETRPSAGLNLFSGPVTEIQVFYPVYGECTLCQSAGGDGTSILR